MSISTVYVHPGDDAKPYKPTLKHWVRRSTGDEYYSIDILLPTYETVTFFGSLEQLQGFFAMGATEEHFA